MDDFLLFFADLVKRMLAGEGHLHEQKQVWNTIKCNLPQPFVKRSINISLICRLKNVILRKKRKNRSGYILVPEWLLGIGTLYEASTRFQKCELTKYTQTGRFRSWAKSSKREYPFGGYFYSVCQGTETRDWLFVPNYIKIISHSKAWVGMFY